jgi:hypothetical protein
MALGDPAPGEDKQLLFSFEVVGTPKLLTKPEDIKVRRLCLFVRQKRVVAMMVTMVVTMGRAQMTLTMDHLYTKTTGKSSPPEEVKLFCADIVKASYGLENRVYDVTTTLRIMLSEQGSHKTRTHDRTRTRTTAHDTNGVIGVRREGSAGIRVHAQAQRVHEQGLRRPRTGTPHPCRPVSTTPL